MTWTEIRNDLKSVRRFGLYVFILFCCYSLYDLIDNPLSVVLETSTKNLLEWSFRLFITPYIRGGVVGSIFAFLGRQPNVGAGAFFSNARRYYLRFLGLDLMLVLFFGTIALTIRFVVSGSMESLSDDEWALSCLGFFASMIRLFWSVAIAGEHGRIGRSLVRGLRTMISGAFPFAVAFAWGLVVSAVDRLDNSFSALNTEAILSVLFGSAVSAIAAIICYVCAASVYRKTRVSIFGETSEDAQEEPQVSHSRDDRCEKAGFITAFISFLPPFNIIALWLGILVLRRRHRLNIKGMTACMLGGFFTILYVVLLVGAMSPRRTVEKTNYIFLKEADSNLISCVELLNKGCFDEAGKQLESLVTNQSNRSAALLCARGIIKINTGDTSAGLAAFSECVEMKPSDSQFYYHYGRQLLAEGTVPDAIQNLKKALTLEPGMKDAELQLELAQNFREPSRATDVIGFIAILLFVFTFHEYAHAYVAWRLGDDTAKAQGRLTLNPIAHLDLIGSILLPAILLWRESSVLFGWAKPVPVDRSKFADPRKGDILVSFAGPAVNLLIAMAAFLLLVTSAAIVRVVWPEAIALNLAAPATSPSFAGVPDANFLIVLFSFLKQLFYTSLTLGFFNLLPIPPLDGSWIIAGLLPGSAGVLFEKIKPYSMIVFIVIIMTPVLDYLLVIPMVGAYLSIYTCFMAMGLG